MRWKCVIAFDTSPSEKLISPAATFVKDEMHAQGLNQQTLSEKIKNDNRISKDDWLSQPAISGIYTGKTTFSKRHKRIFATVLGLDPREIQKNMDEHQPSAATGLGEERKDQSLRIYYRKAAEPEKIKSLPYPYKPTGHRPTDAKTMTEFLDELEKLGYDIV